MGMVISRQEALVVRQTRWHRVCYHQHGHCTIQTLLMMASPVRISTLCRAKHGRRGSLSPTASAAYLVASPTAAPIRPHIWSRSCCQSLAGQGTGQVRVRVGTFGVAPSRSLSLAGWGKGHFGLSSQRHFDSPIRKRSNHLAGELRHRRMQQRLRRPRPLVSLRHSLSPKPWP